MRVRTVADQARRALDGYAPRALPLEAGRREAAVLLLLAPHGGDGCVVFQVRSHHVAHHRGEISLPGGARDTADASLLDTALRETHEEIGVPPQAVDVLGRLDDTMTATSPFRITPFVGALDPSSDVAAWVRGTREVSSLIHVPVTHLLSDASHVWKVVERGGAPAATPAFRFDEHVIWGATARIVGQFVSLLGGAPFADGEPADADPAHGAAPRR